MIWGRTPKIQGKQFQIHRFATCFRWSRKIPGRRTWTALPLPCHHTLPSPPSTSVCTSSPRLPAYLLLSTYFSLISTPRMGAPWGQGLKPLGVLLYLSPPSSLPYWLLSGFRRGSSLPPVMPSHAAAVTPDCTSCSRESSSALTCRPRTPCTPEILNPNPPKAKTSALAPQFPSCGP